MSRAAIAANLGISERAVRFILRSAIAKLRAHPQLCARFRTAVKERRRALDARPGNGPRTTRDRCSSVLKETNRREFW
jgi:hypothetical protein